MLSFPIWLPGGRRPIAVVRRVQRAASFPRPCPVRLTSVSHREPLTSDGNPRGYLPIASRRTDERKKKKTPNGAADGIQRRLLTWYSCIDIKRISGLVWYPESVTCQQPNAVRTTMCFTVVGTRRDRDFSTRLRPYTNIIVIILNFIFSSTLWNLSGLHKTFRQKKKIENFHPVLLVVYSVVQ